MSKVTREYMRAWQRANKSKVRAYNRKFKYGLTEEDLVRILVAQHGHCAICPKPVSLESGVDHDHVTGVVRGVLCHKHNLGLGFFNDDPELMLQAIDYIVTKGKR